MSNSSWSDQVARNIADNDRRRVEGNALVVLPVRHVGNGEFVEAVRTGRCSYAFPEDTRTVTPPHGDALSTSTSESRYVVVSRRGEVVTRPLAKIQAEHYLRTEGVTGDHLVPYVGV